MNINYPQELPITQALDDLRQALNTHQVLIVAGETGSGKSSQLPKLLLEYGQNKPGLIIHTQPRRIAAKAIAKRLAEELNVELGEEIGYQIRFTQKIQHNTQLIVATDGILLSQIMQDPLLKRYSAIILDEVHERSLNLDSLLGYLKLILPKRPDLKLILSSATLELEALCAFWGKTRAKLLEVSGRTYPVEVLYREYKNPYETEIAHSIEYLWDFELGDVLVFLPSERDILETKKYLEKHWQGSIQAGKIAVLSLYARLNQKAQGLVFETSKTGQRVILATNVAETSLTIPGIKYVVDLGTARISRYNPRSRIQRLPIEKISQAAANQRKGRCGRLEHGICIRLYSEEDFKARDLFNIPEILRSNLSAVLLRLIALGIRDLEHFPFLTKPNNRLITDALNQLLEIHAINDTRKLLPLGQKLMRLPLDPALGAMLLNAQQHHCVAEILSIVAFLSVGDPRERPLGEETRADQKQALFKDKQSDFSSILKLWLAIEESKKVLSKKKFKAWCETHYLSHQKIKEWEQTHQELQGLLQEYGLIKKEHVKIQEIADYAAIHKALLIGLLPGIGLQSRTNKQAYQGIRNRQFYIFPGSAVFKAQPEWIMSFALVDTKKVYARWVAKMDLKWLLEIFGHLIVYAHTQGHWDPEKGGVYAYEQASLYGLILYQSKKVYLPNIDLLLARSVFIREALLNLEYIENIKNFNIKNWNQNTQKFFKNHQEQLIEWQEVGEKTRNQELLNLENLYVFLDERLGEAVCNFETLNHFAAKQQNIQNLLWHWQQFNNLAFSQEHYPEELKYGDWKFEISYFFKPGDEADGATVFIPKILEAKISKDRLDWLVPGLLLEKIAFWIKHLPKSKRLDCSESLLQALLAQLLEQAHQTVAEALSIILNKQLGIEIGPVFFNKIALPEHLRFRVAWLNEKSEILEYTRVSQGPSPEIEVNSSSLAIDVDPLERAYQAFPEQIPQIKQSKIGGQVLDLYLGLVPIQNQAFKLQGFIDHNEALMVHRKGIKQLIFLEHQTYFYSQIKKGLGYQQVVLGFAGWFDAMDLIQDLILASIEHVLPESDLPYARSDFEQLVFNIKHKILEKSKFLFETLKIVESIYSSFKIGLKNLESRGEIQKTAYADIMEQLKSLWCPDFIQKTQENLYFRMPFYLQGIRQRLKKIEENPKQAQALYLSLLPVLKKYKAMEVQDLDTHYALEELRLSIFSPNLKTQLPISIKKFEQILNKKI